MKIRKSGFPNKKWPNCTEAFRQEACCVFQNWRSKGQLRFCFDVRNERPKLEETKSKDNHLQKGSFFATIKYSFTQLESKIWWSKGTMRPHIRWTTRKFITPMQFFPMSSFGLVFPRVVMIRLYDYFSSLCHLLAWRFLVLHFYWNVCNWNPKLIWLQMNWFCSFLENASFRHRHICRDRSLQELLKCDTLLLPSNVFDI